MQICVISLCSNNEEILAHCKPIFVCHANIVHFVNTLDVVLYLNIWHPFGVVQLYQFEVTLNINNHNSVGWNIRSFSTLCWHQWIHCMNRISKHKLTKIHSPTMSNVSFTIHTPIQRTVHPTGPTIPDTYCISTFCLQYQSNHPSKYNPKIRCPILRDWY